MSFNVQQLYEKLHKFYWSPRHPNDYVIKLYGRTVGIGLTAGQDYAAFNYAWATTPLSLDTEAGQRAVTCAWVAGKQITGIRVGDTDLAWHMTRQGLLEFKTWYASNWKTISQDALPVLRKLYEPNEIQTLL